MTLEKLKYPIGKFSVPEEITDELIKKWIAEINIFPRQLRTTVAKLSEEQLNTPYRLQGWTLRQVIHHCADSHMNSLIRLKLTLTEDNPTIKPYWEDRWAELPDGKYLSIEPSLKIIEGIHQRWTVLLNNLSKEDLCRTYFHPDNEKKYPVIEYIGLYAWHCNHHLAHITETIKRQNWE